MFRLLVHILSLSFQHTSTFSLIVTVFGPCISKRFLCKVAIPNSYPDHMHAVTKCKNPFTPIGQMANDFARHSLILYSELHEYRLIERTNSAKITFIFFCFACHSLCLTKYVRLQNDRISSRLNTFP